jgi:ABC-type transporter MlaC component
VRTKLIGSSAFAAFLLASAVPTEALEADSAVTAFVARINTAVAPVKAGDQAGIRAACASLVKQAFDFDAMAPAIVAEAWKRMNAGQKAAYTRGLAKRAASECTSHGSEIAGNTVEIIGVREGGGGDRVVAVKQSKGRGRTVLWQVRKSSGGLKAVDMTVDGRSLATSARRDAKNVLKRSDGDLSALIKSVGG